MTETPAPDPGSHRVRMIVRSLALFLMLAAWTGSHPAAGRADAPGSCPASVVYFARGLGTAFSTDAEVFDSTFTDVYTARVTFDRSQARTALTASSGGRLAASSRVVERFDVTGVSPGTPIDATLEFHLEGWSQNNCGGGGCGVELVATLACGPDSVTADATQPGPGSSRRDLATTLRLPVRLVAGSPITAQFSLAYATGPGGGAEAAVTGWYGLSGLPAGARAIACPGADVTPARRSSWGEVKSLYR